MREYIETDNGDNSVYRCDNYRLYKAVKKEQSRRRGNAYRNKEMFFVKKYFQSADESVFVKHCSDKKRELRGADKQNLSDQP